MKSINVFILFLFAFNFCNAQNNSAPKKNAVSLELGKLGLIYNVSFDHQFPNNHFGYRVFTGSNFAKYLKAATVGIGGYYLVGHSANFLELGIDLSYLSIEEISNDQRGVPLIISDYPIKTYYASANIGYRRAGDKTLFRIGFSPGFTKKEFVPGGYISFGIAF